MKPPTSSSEMAKGEHARLFAPEEGTEAITIGQFSGNEELEEVCLPLSLRKIEDYAFANCLNLTTIELPEGLREIGESAFIGCSSITRVKIPNSVKSIGENAFADCASLQTIEFPDDFKDLSPNLVRGCYALEEIKLGDSYSIVDGHIIDSTTKELILSLPNTAKDKTIRIPNTITQIHRAALALCKDADKVALPKEVEEIDGSTFTGLDNLKTIDIEEGGKMQFWDGFLAKDDTIIFHTPHLTRKNFIIPAHIKGIGTLAFARCEGLESVTVEGSATEAKFEIGESAFCECPDLRKIEICCSVNIGPKAFLDCAELEFVQCPQVVAVGDFAFANCTRLTEAPLSEKTTHIGNDAFANCAALKKISIPTEVKWISAGAFADCKSLEDVDFHDDIECIRSQAFLGCTKLKNIDLPKDLKSIGHGAFAWCGLQSIAIPPKVEHIDDFAFAMCKNIEAATMPSAFFDRTSQIFIGDNKLQMMGSNDIRK